MTANEVISSWEKIQQGVKEAETPMGKGEYNLSMVKARQTLEFMVHCLCGPGRYYGTRSVTLH